MINVFETTKIYPQGWKVIESRKFNDAEKASIASVEIVQGDYGLSACFTLISGGYAYFQLSRDSIYTINDKPKVEDLTYLKLERDGETCERIL